jgi:hypothetical protein
VRKNAQGGQMCLRVLKWNLGKRRKANFSMAAKKSEGHKITENDIAILTTINRFGFMTVREIAKITGRLETVVYSRLKVLCDYELLENQRLFYGKPGAYWLTYQGKIACESPLSTIKGPRIATYNHDLCVIAVYIELKKKYGEKLSWLTAREIMSEKFAASKNGEASPPRNALAPIKGHIADGVALFDDKKFAVEVELSMKGPARLKKIIAEYVKALNSGIFNAVLYDTNNPHIADRLKEVITAVTGQLAGHFRIGKI